MIDQNDKLAPPSVKHQMLVVDLPKTDYGEALAIQTGIVKDKISFGGPDVLLVLEHPPTVTLGIRGNQSHLLVSHQELAKRGISLFNVDRGGGATYHGPGQLVVYPIIDLRLHRLSVRQYVQKLEKTLIQSVASLGFKAFARQRAPGIWINEKSKIASIGIRIHQHITSHGFSLNVNLPSDPADLIIVCRAPDVTMTSLKQVLPDQVSMETVREIVVRRFGKVFSMNLTSCTLQDILRYC